MTTLVRGYCGLAGIMLLGSAGVFWGMLIGQAMPGPTPGQTVWPSAAVQTSIVHTLWMAATATGVAAVLSIPAAVGMSISARTGRRVLLALSLAPLLSMPSIFAYALLILSTSPNATVRAVTDAIGLNSLAWAPLHAGLVLGVWLWPIPALLLAAGFRNAGASAFRLASLDAGPVKAFVRAVIPALSGTWATGCMVVFLLATLDSTIGPFVSASRVWGVELMADAAAAMGTKRPAAFLFYRAWPMMAVLVTLVCLFWHLVSRTLNMAASTSIGDESALPRVSRSIWIVCAAIVALFALGPVTIYVVSMFSGRHGIGESFIRAWHSGRHALGSTAIVAFSTAAAGAGIAILLLEQLREPHWIRILKKSAAYALLLIGLLPPALIGCTIVAFYSHPKISPAGTWNLYDATPLPWIAAMLCRYAFIPVFAVRMSNRHIGNTLSDQALVDGATPIQSLIHARLPMLRRTLVISMLFVAALVMNDVSVSGMIQPSRWGGGSLAFWIDSQMHYGRHRYTTALAILMQAISALLVIAMVFAGGLRCALPAGRRQKERASSPSNRKG